MKLKLLRAVAKAVINGKLVVIIPINPRMSLILDEARGVLAFVMSDECAACKHRITCSAVSSVVRPLVTT